MAFLYQYINSSFFFPKIFQLMSEVFKWYLLVQPIPPLYKQYEESCRKLFESQHFWSRIANSTVDKKLSVTDWQKRTTGMLFYFVRYVIFFRLSKEFPDQNNFTNKCTGILLWLIGIFYFKIDYNDINQILKSIGSVRSGSVQT